MNIDNLTNDIISKHSQPKCESNVKHEPTDRISEDEPKFVITTKWFKKWKTIKRTYTSENDAYCKYNNIMSKLENLDNIVIDKKHSKVVQRNTAPTLAEYYHFVYDVSIYWRNA